MCHNVSICVNPMCCVLRTALWDQMGVAAFSIYLSTVSRACVGMFHKWILTWNLSKFQRHPLAIFCKLQIIQNHLHSNIHRSELMQGYGAWHPTFLTSGATVSVSGHDVFQWRRIWALGPFGLATLSASLRSLHQVPFPKAPKVPKASKASANVKERSEIDVDVEAKPIPFSDGCLHLLRHLRIRDLYRWHSVMLQYLQGFHTFPVQLFRKELKVWVSRENWPKCPSIQSIQSIQSYLWVSSFVICGADSCQADTKLQSSSPGHWWLSGYVARWTPGCNSPNLGQLICQNMTTG